MYSDDVLPSDLNLNCFLKQLQISQITSNRNVTGRFLPSLNQRNRNIAGKNENQIATYEGNIT